MKYLFISDMDGTILKDGSQTVPQRTIDNVVRLTDMGAIFVPASGRQYPTLVRQFKQTERELAYICENGALVMYKDTEIYKSSIDKDLALQVIEKIYNCEECEVLISGTHVSYLRPKTEAYLHRIRDVVGNKVVVVDDFKDIKEDIIKFSAYDSKGIDRVSQYLSEGLLGKLSMAISGSAYMDFTNIGVNKGNAVKKLCEYFDIPVTNTVSFGDNFNDCELFKMTNESYCMKSADVRVKQQAKYEIEDVNDILEKYITKGV